MNTTEHLRTPHFPSEKYPEHWGPFELHSMVPYSRGLPPLEVDHYQIIIDYKPANTSVVVGFDDFAPAWPMDRDEDLSPKAIKRRDKYRGMAQFRALVKIKKVNHLSAQGVEQLRDAGADVNEAACRQGLWIAVYGKYYNLPVYRSADNENEKVKHLVKIQVIHQTAEVAEERMLFIGSMDPRTAVRSFLYFERIKLLRFMERVSKEDNGRTEIRDRSIEWFVNKMMEMYPFNNTCVPEKKDSYRGARRHTSEARHVFVCHAEWLLECTTVHRGAERCISKRVLEDWVALAPRLRELAVQEERAGWGVWDAVWDKVDFTEWYKKERGKFNYYLKAIRNEEERDESIPSSFSSRRSGSKPIQLDKGKGRATTVDEEGYSYGLIHDPSPVDEEEGAGGVSLDEDEWEGRAKRPRISLSQEAAPSGTQRTHSGPSLGRGSNDRIPSSLSRDYYQPSPSLAIRTPSSVWSPKTTSHYLGSARDSLPHASSSLGRNLSSSWRFTSQKGPSSGTPPTSHRSPGTRLLKLSIQPRPQSSDALVIYISSDDDDIPMLTADVACRSIAPKSEIIDITDSSSEDYGESMRAASEMGQVEDTLIQGYYDDEPPNLRQRTSAPRETVIGETPPPGHRPQPSSGRLDSPSIEEISDSQEEFGSSDSESKYAQPVPRSLDPKIQRNKKLQELNQQILLFAPLVFSTVYAPQTWRPWRCNYPNQALKPGVSDLKTAHSFPCMFEIDLRLPSLEVQRLLNQYPGDAELLKHLLTEPCIFKGPTDELPIAIFSRVVELHREEHFKHWGVVRKITDTGGTYRAHFEPLNENQLGDT
ncbi:unnamed protein product [Rhizoctonia solani]|uniref:Uncharacterized protein n=1 Tax=Rhizoctonia solani TaxID=456999 RepID=A0A8H3H1Z1_9AGAM|nr:unnamed protein product [Rhizoctonia solani]